MYCCEMSQEDYWEAYEELLEKVFMLYDKYGASESESHLWKVSAHKGAFKVHLMLCNIASGSGISFRFLISSGDYSGKRQTRSSNWPRTARSKFCLAARFPARKEYCVT